MTRARAYVRTYMCFSYLIEFYTHFSASFSTIWKYIIINNSLIIII